MKKITTKNIFCLFTIYCCLFTVVYAGGPGTTGGIMLAQPVSARASGMGDVFTAVSDDVNAVYWNPAGLCNLSKTEFSAMYNDSLMDTAYTNLSYAKPVKLWGSAFGASISIFDGGALAVNSPTGFTENVKAQYDYSASIAYGKKIFTKWFKQNANKWKLNFGVGFKTYSSTLAQQYTAGSLALDLGLLLQNKSGFSAGLTVQNIGRNVVYIYDEYPLPQATKIGAAYKFGNILHSYLAGIEAVNTIDSGTKFHLGAEYWYAKLLALRVGYKSGYDLGSVTLGAGIYVKGYQIDYAFGDMGILGNTQKISYTMRY